MKIEQYNIKQKKKNKKYIKRNNIESLHFLTTQNEIKIKTFRTAVFLCIYLHHNHIL